MKHQYQNGNYIVTIDDENGTRIKETEADSFIAAFPDSLDCKLTNRCDLKCKYCHENSTPDGEHGDILNVEFINSLRPYSEIALGGGNTLCHPDLVEFLHILKEKKVIANMTVNQKHFMNDIELLRKLTDEKLIYGLGISFQSYSDEFVKVVQQFPNAVLHVINGVVDINELKKLYGKGLKLLILGYKQFRRGLAFYSSEVEQRKQEMYAVLPELTKKFKVVSFDNKALLQLDVKRLLSEEQWQEFFQGDDGQSTLYVDLVNKKFAINSTSDVTYDLLDTIDEMFKIVSSQSC
jgi:hypothetical protein